MTGRADVLDKVPGLAELAVKQSMVLTRAQLAHLGVSDADIASHMHARRWREVVTTVLVLHLGPLDARARMWAAVLAGGPAAALCAWTALELHGLHGWERPDVHIVVPRGRLVPALGDTTVHESRRHGRADITQVHDLPVHSVERAAIDSAAWSRSVRAACGVVAAAVQQRLSTADRLLQALDASGRVRHRRALGLALLDIAGGSQAMSEIDFVRLCRSVGLPEPVRQRVRTDDRGRRRYLDAEWEPWPGYVVAVEIDGIHHVAERQWYDDLLRQAELADGGRRVMVRLPASALRLEPARVVAILRRALTPA